MTAGYNDMSTMGGGLPNPHAKPGKVKRWLARQMLLKPKTCQLSQKNAYASLERPRTAPRDGAGLDGERVRLLPVPPLAVDRSWISLDESLRGQHPPPPPPPPPPCDVGNKNQRSHGGRMSTAPPIMGGLEYWREKPTYAAEKPPVGQYAVPIVRDPDPEPPKPSSTRAFKSIYRRARKMQVRMPSLRRVGSKQAARLNTSASRPTASGILAVAYDDVEEGPPPIMMTRIKYGDEEGSGVWAKSKVGREDSIGMGQASSLSLPLGHKIAPCYSSRPDDLRPTLSSASTAVDVPRDGSFSSLHLSEAPTYFTGPVPPSYRSRPASMVTTSSFGCINGLPSERRQRHQRRRQHGVKSRLKMFAQKALLAK